MCAKVSDLKESIRQKEERAGIERLEKDIDNDLSDIDELDTKDTLKKCDTGKCGDCFECSANLENLLQDSD